MFSVNLFALDIYSLCKYGYFQTDSLNDNLFNITYSMVFLMMNIGLIILKIYTTSFKHQCDQMKSCSNSTLVPASTEVLALYQSIKKGSGPLYIVLYNITTLFLTTALFQVARGLATPAKLLFGIISQVLTLYELSKAGQDLHDTLCSCITLIRY